MLLSMTADQWLRFWDLNDLQSPKPPIWKIYADHMSPAINPELIRKNEEAAQAGDQIPYVVAPDQLTGVAVTAVDNDSLVTTDTNGRIKMFKIRTDFREGSKEEIEAKISNPWFIKAHRQLINSVEMVEQLDKDVESDNEDDDDDSIELPEGIVKTERQPWPDIFILTAS